MRTCGKTVVLTTGRVIPLLQRKLQRVFYHVLMVNHKVFYQQAGVNFRSPRVDSRDRGGQDAGHRFARIRTCRQYELCALDLCRSSG